MVRGDVPDTGFRTRKWPSLKRINLDFAAELIDFDPKGGGVASKFGFGRSQLEGTVATYNMLAENDVAYIADEVGMGKTYVALGVMGLVRHMNPSACILVLTPRENIQRKWIKELQNFVGKNWKVIDGRVKSIQEGPVREPLLCQSLAELAQSAARNADRDLFLRMTSFSLALKQAKSRKGYQQDLKSVLPWIDGRVLAANRRPEEFRDAYGRVLNAVLPEIDLLIVDEAHNLKHGFGDVRVSIRNRILGLALGHERGAADEAPWYGSKVKKLLMLSATPFETDFGDLYRQLDLLGKGAIRLRTADGKTLPVIELVDDDTSFEAEARKSEIVEQLLIRRVSWLDIANERWTKNMYRREWRSGGYRNHDQPMRFDDPKQGLVVGLIQKKVAEIIGSERFNSSFQIGMLSSFESFLETISRKKKRDEAEGGDFAASEDDPEEEDDERVFEGQQEASTEERRGADSLVLSAVLDSHRKRFGQSLPHPKLDATVEEFASAFKSGEKVLVFVRRVATVRELSGKLNRAFDAWIEAHMRAALPGLGDEIGHLFERYGNETHEVSSSLRAAAERGDDEGGTDNFFAWFFRGAGPEGILSGAAFQKNRLASASSLYSTLFEDDYVSWLLGRPSDVIGALAVELGCAETELNGMLRREAWHLWRSKQKEGFPRHYVFEAYQAAAMGLLGQMTTKKGNHAKLIRTQLWPDLEPQREDEPPSGFPQASAAIGITTFFTELVKRPELRGAIWPEEESADFERVFRKREQRRELISAMTRLGASYIDLYLLAIRQIGSFALRSRTDAEGATPELAGIFVEMLDEQRRFHSDFGAYRELAAAAEAFETILAVNFPEVRGARLSEVAETFGRALQGQAPVGAMSGGVNRRQVGQFRMPGFPLVLVTTDVLQEGEDLHTFCRRVVHYGIAWTPSAMEQRTGRIDRIGSLVQRRLDGARDQPEPKDLIQVHYPHLQGTVEVLQVQRVLRRLDRFMRLVHDHKRDGEKADSRLDAAREMLTRSVEIEPLLGPLTSAFPVREDWLQGENAPELIHRTDFEPLIEHLETMWLRFTAAWLNEERRAISGAARKGRVRIDDYRIVRPEEAGPDSRRQGFELELRSHPVLQHAILRCSSPVGELGLKDSWEIDELYTLQQELEHARVCARRRLNGGFVVTIEEDMVFHPETTQYEEFETLIRRSCEAADLIEKHFFVEDGNDEADA